MNQVKNGVIWYVEITCCSMITMKWTEWILYNQRLPAAQRISHKRFVNKGYVRADYSWRYNVSTIVAMILVLGSKGYKNIPGVIVN